MNALKYYLKLLHCIHIETEVKNLMGSFLSNHKINNYNSCVFEHILYSLIHSEHKQ